MIIKSSHASTIGEYRRNLASLLLCPSCWLSRRAVKSAAPPAPAADIMWLRGIRLSPTDGQLAKVCHRVDCNIATAANTLSLIRLGTAATRGRSLCVHPRGSKLATLRRAARKFETTAYYCELTGNHVQSATAPITINLRSL